MSVPLRFAGLTAILFVATMVCAGPASARPGDPDPGFGESGLTVTPPATGDREIPADMAGTPDGGVVVAGSALIGPESVVSRYLPDGSPDPTFGDGGRVRTTGHGWDQVEVQPDGRIVLAGSHGDQIRLARLNAGGDPDPTFGGDGIVSLQTTALFEPPEGVSPNSSISSLSLLNDQSIRVIGSFAGCAAPGYYICGEAFIAGLDADGTPSAGLAAGGVKNLGIRGQGIRGEALLSTTFGNGRSLVIRSEISDPPFGGPLYSIPISASGAVEAEVRLSSGADYYPSLGQYPGGIHVDQTGRVLFSDGDSVWRLQADGHPDIGFGDRGRVDVRDLTRFLPGGPTLIATGIATDADGRILLAGGPGYGSGDEWQGDTWASSGAVARLSADGSIDPSFGGGGLAVAWTGLRARKRLQTRTSILTDADGITIAGLGPAGDSYGFTLARLGNGEMELPRCNGRKVDYVGSPGPDRVEAHMSVIASGGGDDVVTGSGYNTTVCSGKGNDSVSLGFGPAKVFGGMGQDRIRLEGADPSGEAGIYEAHGGAGDDRIFGSDRSDRLLGDGGDDRIYGGGRDDRLRGGTGRDRLYGQSGRDRLFGGPGLDVLKVGPIGPDPTDYLSRLDDGFVQVTTLGRKASAYFRVPMVCFRADDRLGQASKTFGYNPATGKLDGVTGSWEELEGYYGGFISDIRGRIRNGRIKGEYRIIDTFGRYCRSGDLPIRSKTLLGDAWMPFSARAEPKPRQLARQ